MRLNTASAIHPVRNHEGAPAVRLSPMQALRRSVCASFLWEDSFYESGQAIADRVVDLAHQVPVEDLAALAIELRSRENLRHMPLLLLSVLARRASGNALVADTIEQVLQRADEPAEFLMVHARLNNVAPNRIKPVISAQMKKGLARAMGKFGAYALAKYDREGPIRLRDVLFLSHAKAKDEAQAALWHSLINGELTPPDTWEVALSGGADKREAFTRLLSEGKLGYLALLRNLRNMVDAGVDETLIREAILARKGADRVLPFRFTAAARACPRLEPVLDEALSERILEMPVLDGNTIVLVDVSGSMNVPLSRPSGKRPGSDLTRMDAAATLASIIHGRLRVATFSTDLVEVAPRRGMAGVDAVIRSQPHRSTNLDQAVAWANTQAHDRLIVITDEQAQSAVRAPVARHAYMINVANAQHAIGFGKWTRIDGFSENILRFIGAHEALGVPEAA